jgi:hypothetical protein
MEVEFHNCDPIDCCAAQVVEMTAVAAILLSASLLQAADLSTYRGFGFGADVATIAKQAGMKPADAKVIHQQPALIQQMEWQLRPEPFIADPPRPDPVRGGVLSFVDGKLYQIVVTYDRYRIEGMTTEDMIRAISQTYGSAHQPGTEIRFHSNYGDVAKVLARWEDAVYAYDLVRTGDQSGFALVLYAKEADAAARQAILEGSRLDALDAPRRVREAERKRLEDGQLALEKARAANQPNFKP